MIKYLHRCLPPISSPLSCSASTCVMRGCSPSCPLPPHSLPSCSWHLLSRVPQGQWESALMGSLNDPPHSSCNRPAFEGYYLGPSVGKPLESNEDDDDTAVVSISTAWLQAATLHEQCLLLPCTSLCSSWKVSCVRGSSSRHCFHATHSST